jgi:pyruvate dehydrogenase E1 component alpha subunit
MAFEEEIKQLFLDKRIRAPVHLSRGNEDALVKIFKKIKPEDWVFSTHRSHYHALLKGIDPDWLKQEILEGRSIHIYNREHRFFSSAIVSGCLPIAVGVAMAIKRKGENRHVWCFTGDMGAETGIFHECTKYARRNDLPITFVVEDNQLSINTPTQVVWGQSKSKANIISYRYRRGVPHVGVGVWVTF